MAYEAIASTTLSSSAASVVFSSIPSTYEHLQIRAYMRSTSVADTFVRSYFRFNSDTGTNYAEHNLVGNGSSPTSAAVITTTSCCNSIVSGSNAAANIYGVIIFDLLDYASSNKYRTARALSGVDTNGNGRAAFSSGLWLNTAAVTSITLSLDNNISAGSVVALYGLKSA